MRRFIRVLGILLVAGGILFAAGSIGVWASLGAHPGWSKTYIEVSKTDEITGIEFTERVDRFVPGVDFLAPGILAGFVCIIAGGVILTRTKLKT